MLLFYKNDNRKREVILWSKGEDKVSADYILIEKYAGKYNEVINCSKEY